MHNRTNSYADGPLLLHCHALVPGINPAYGYVPSLAAGVVFCVLFGLSFSSHLFRSFRYRRWSSYCLFIGAVVEFLGWAGRTWSAKCPYNKTAFLIQISTLVIAPMFFAASIYLILGRLIVRRGPQYSLLPPRKYLWTFCTCDIVSLFIQAAGGGIASAEANKNIDTNPGTHLIVGGILFQLASMTAFGICMTVFLFRSRLLVMPKQEKLVVAATILSFFCIYIRSTYRSVELLQGWRGFLITHERFFVALDAAMMVIAGGVFNFLDPALLLKSDDKDGETGMQSERSIVEIEEQRSGDDREKERSTVRSGSS